MIDRDRTSSESVSQRDFLKFRVDNDDKYSIIDSQQKGTDMLPEWLTPGTSLVGLVLLAGVCWLADKMGWWK